MHHPTPDPAALPRSAPSAQGVDADGIRAFVDALEAADHVEPHSLMLLRHGHVVAEGWWHPYTPDGVQGLYSLSKTFACTALGLAVAEGLVGLDDTVLSHFPELEAEVTDPRSRRMLVRHVASMASGHLGETIDRVLAADAADPVRGFLRLPPDREPGSVFAYNQPCTYTVGAIVSRRAGQSLTDYLRPRLLDPLGIGEVAWQRDASGRELAYSGLHATTDAVARLGQLYLQRGVWRGEQLLPESWVDEASALQVANSGTNDSPDWVRGYGFGLWRSRHGYRGDGAYGQFCLVLPEHDAVLALTAATPDLQGVLEAVWEHVVPAMRDASDGATGASPDADTAPVATVAADAALAARLGSAGLAPLPGAPAPPDAVAHGWEGLVAEATDGPVRRLAVTRDGTVWHVSLTGAQPADADAPLTVALGTADAGRWGVQAAGLPDAGTVPVAVGGGWTGPDQLTLDVLFHRTPHRLTVGCTRGGALTARWRTEPLGGVALADLRAPA